MKVYIQKRGLRKITWAVMREGRKTAVRIFQDLDKAIDYVITIGTPILMNYWNIIVKDTEDRIIRKEFRMKKVVTSTFPSSPQPEE